MTNKKDQPTSDRAGRSCAIQDGGGNSRGEASRRKLLQAASDLMTERGSIDVSISEIGERAVLNSALIKYYFGNKQSMMLHLLKVVVGNEIDNMRSMMCAELTSREKLRRHVGGIVDLNARYPYVTKLVYSLLQDPAYSPQLLKLVSAPVAEAQRELLDQGLAEGTFKKISPAFFYAMVFGASEHIFAQSEVLRSVYDVDPFDPALRRDYTLTLVDILLDGLMAKPR